MSVAKKVLKPIKKIPGAILKGPRKLLKAFGKLYERIAKLASAAQLLPVDTLSGKLLAVCQLFLVVTVFLALGSGLAALRQVPLPSGGIETLTRASGGVTAVTLVLFLVTYPLDRRGTIRRVLVGTGFRQRRRISPGRIGFLIALVPALVIAAVVARAIPGVALSLPSVVDVLGVVTVFAATVGLLTAIVAWLLAYQNDNYVSTVLTVVAVRELDDDTQSVTLRNDGDGPVELWRAKVVDSRGNRYELDDDVSFRPGDRRDLKLPASFDVEPTDYRVPPLLGWLYDDERTTTVYNRDGDTFRPTWEDEQ